VRWCAEDTVVYRRFRRSFRTPHPFAGYIPYEPLLSKLFGVSYVDRPVFYRVLCTHFPDPVRVGHQPFSESGICWLCGHRHPEHTGPYRFPRTDPADDAGYGGVPSIDTGKSLLFEHGHTGNAGLGTLSRTSLSDTVRFKGGPFSGSREGRLCGHPDMDSTEMYGPSCTHPSHSGGVAAHL